MAFARAAAMAMIPRLVGYGWSSSKIIGWLGDYNATYRRATMLADIRRYTNMQAFGSRVIGYDNEKLFPKSMMGEHDLTRARRYRIYATAKYTDRESGAVSYRRLSFYDDTRRSKTAWGDEFKRMVGTENYMAEFDIDDVDVLYVEHNRGLDY